MKNLIIIIGTVLLGCIIFDLMVGDHAESLRSVSAEIMRQTAEAYG